ncbi:surface lipoprotein assembly modifier [Novosphingobium sp. BL-52-GroH]|uniref:surface lipoprotein assembly modifier n=1 Tax=Novosphingobium sp. BL-52-GroH TaxID=3349877 RepID=UPI00384DBF67
MSGAGAQDTGVLPPPVVAQTHLSAAQVFALAGQAREKGDFATAETAYAALTRDPDIELRTEARFRLGLMLADDLKRYGDAALEFRRILDDKPGAARVRLELARMQAMLGNMGAARKELRAAQAAGLPSAVEQLVRFYSRALNARKPLGGSIEVAIAPDSNINRATRSDTLGTVIGDFTLDDDARAQSGVGLDLQGQGYFRLGIEPGTDLLVRASTDAKLYREADFDDVTVALQAGPQYTWGGNQLTFSAGPARRWYGRQLFSTTIGGGVSWQRPVGKRGQVRLDGNIAHVNNRRNALQTADDFTLSASFDRAFSARFGGGVQAFGFREAARDPGYSLAMGGASAYLFRELGRTTLVGTLGYSHLEADARLFLYPNRRVEDRYSASIAATLRALHLGSFAPLVRLKWERNRSSIEIYDYRRVAAEFGVTSAF